MYPVTHITIAVGAVRTGQRLRRLFAGAPKVATREIDYRFVALGSLLPDLIDKPLKWFLFRKQLPDSHVYGHTLLLPLTMITAGLALARRGDSRLLWAGIGCLTHPLVDPVLTYPRTLFWPLLGTRFPKAHGFIGLLPTLALEGALIAALTASPRGRELAQRLLATGALTRSSERT